MKIYLHLNGEISGPWTKPEIFEKLRNHEIGQDTAARLENSEEWTVVEEVLKSKTGFFSLEQLDQIQTSSPPPAIIIPDLERHRPLRQEEPEKQTSSLRWIGIAAVVVLALALGLKTLVFQSPPAEEEPGQMVHQSPTPAEAVNTVAKTEIPKLEPTPLPAVSKPTPPPVEHAIVAAPEAEAADRPATQDVAGSINEPNPRLDPVEDTVAPPAVADVPSSSEPISPPEEALPPATPEPQVVAENNAIPAAASSARKFFQIDSIAFLKRAPRNGIGVWGRRDEKDGQFLPSLEMKVAVDDNVASETTFARAYFFDSKNKLLHASEAPTGAGKRGERPIGAPTVYVKDKKASLFFVVPEEVLAEKWKAVVVFGDKFEARSICFPPNEKDLLTEYPEKKLVYDKSVKAVQRKKPMEYLSETVVRSKNPRMPKLTMFMRAPTSVSDQSEIKGVLALCIFAEDVQWVKNELQKDEKSEAFSTLFKFANEHKLAILAWGSTGVMWNWGLNSGETGEWERRNNNDALDRASDSWERGMKILTDKYGIERKNFLLWGVSRSAQWAHRLCLRKPEYFLAIHFHISSSFDIPRQEASDVLWCVTTGENDGGYENSKKFVAECRQLGYPLVYKAIPGLGHGDARGASDLGLKFFEFALQVKEARDLESKGAKIAAAKTNPVWKKGFTSPPFYGDMVNQEMFPASEVEMIPKGFRVSLPTEDLAKLWQTAAP